MSMKKVKFLKVLWIYLIIIFDRSLNGV